MWAVFIALACLTAVSRAAPRTCADLLRHVDKPQPPLEGRFFFVAASLNQSRFEGPMLKRESSTFDFHNSSFTQSHRVASQCHSRSYPYRTAAGVLSVDMVVMNFTATFLATSCPDCGVVVWETDSPIPGGGLSDLYLFSKRREVLPEEMKEFRAQAQCQSRRPPIVMDQTTSLCSETTQA